jgi:hypothetical protein
VSREWRLYLEDIRSCCDRVLEYTSGLDFAGFIAHSMTYDAVIRNLEIIGEAAAAAITGVITPVLTRTATASAILPTSFPPQARQSAGEIAVP